MWLLSTYRYTYTYITPYTIYRYIDAPYLNDEELLASDTTDTNTSSNNDNNTEEVTSEHKEENTAATATAAPATRSAKKNSKYIHPVYICVWYSVLLGNILHYYYTHIYLPYNHV